jgi:hypothetical protein
MALVKVKPTSPGRRQFGGGVVGAGGSGGTR